MQTTIAAIEDPTQLASHIFYESLSSAALLDQRCMNLPQMRSMGRGSCPPDNSACSTDRRTARPSFTTVKMKQI